MKVYYIRFIPINKQDVVIDLRTSGHIRSEEWSDRKDGGKHPNIRASAIVQDTESLTPTAETQKAHKVNGCRIKRITQKIPAKVYGTPEQAIKHLNTLICLFQNGKFGKYKENNKNKQINCNRNMKQTIRLTESELRGMINEVVNEAVAYRTKKINEGKRNNAVKLTESLLREMINVAVNKALNEMDYDDYNKAKQQHPNLMSKVDPRTFANRERGVNAQGKTRNDDQAVMKDAAVDAWNQRFGFKEEPGGMDYYYQWMDDSQGDNFSNNFGSKYGINYKNSHIGFDGQRKYNNYAYNPKTNTEWHGFGTNGDTPYTKEHKPDGDNGTHRIAYEMEHGNGQYDPNKGWQ